MTLETILTDEIIAEYTTAGYWPNKVITDFLDEAVTRTPDKVAAIDPRRQVTYAELAAAEGYADQPHLTRDFHELAGIQPAKFVAETRAGGFVQDVGPEPGER